MGKFETRVTDRMQPEGIKKLISEMDSIGYDLTRTWDASTTCVGMIFKKRGI
jgi:hypothetical protein